MACVLTAVTLALIIRSFSAASGSWTHAEQRADAFRDARSAIEILSRDLRTVAPAFATVNGDAVAGNPPSLVLDYDPATAPVDQVNEELYALTMQPNAAQNDLCTVGYRCVWDSASCSYVLKRRYKDGNATFASLQRAGAGKPEYSFTDLYFTPGDGSVEEEVASCIWGLTIRPCLSGSVSSVYPRQNYSNNLPAWVEICFHAMAGRSIEKLKAAGVNRDTWFNPDSKVYKHVILPYQQVFMVRVRLNAASMGATAAYGMPQGSTP